MSALAPAALLALAAAPAAPQRFDPVQRFDPTQEVGLDQRLGAELPRELVFTADDGRAVALGELVGERPVVLVLVYYECPMLCTLVFDGLLRAFRPLELDPGSDFDVVAVSIDPREGPGLARAKKGNLVASLGRGDASGWHLLTGEESAIRALADAVGFRYVYDEASGEYAHAGGLMVVTPEGRLSHYFYGVDYAPRDLRLALVEASDGRIGSLVDQVLMLCMHWDPTVGRYGFAVMRALQVAGGATALAIGLFVGRMLLRERRARRAAAVGAE